MTTDYCIIAERLLADVLVSHNELVAYAGAGEAVRQGLAAVYGACAAGVVGLSEDQLLVTPSPEEWSMAEVLEHVAEHDRHYDEYHRLGLDHYIEHGLEHALQLWRLRPVAPLPGDDGAQPAT